MNETRKQLISYIAPAAPATRRPADGELGYLRPEIGFTPRWFHNSLGINFGSRWHTDPAYRMESRIEMYRELELRFPSWQVGRFDSKSVDILTGTFGTSAIASIYGVPVRYSVDNWPVSEHQYLSDDEVDKLTPPDLDENPFFCLLMEQVDWIGSYAGEITGYMNWQGVLNNAQRIRGERIFTDMYTDPGRSRHLFDCICTTMIEAARRLNSRKNSYSPSISFFTVSNCIVNLINPEFYREYLLPLDLKIGKEFDFIGIHNCAWNADPYLDLYAKIPGVSYIDMGIDSELEMARRLFPKSRRAIMYTPTDIENKTTGMISKDLEQIAQNYGPCDIVAADIDLGTHDSKVLYLIEGCRKISEKYRGF